MKSTAIACALGAILVSFGSTAFAQGFDRGGDDQPRFEQREQRGDRAWRRHAEDRRFERRAFRHGDQARDIVWGEGREQVLVVEQEQRHERPARGALTVIVQMPAPPAVSVVAATERTIIRPQQHTHAVTKVARPLARRAVVAKAAACAAPAATVSARPRAAPPA